MVSYSPAANAAVQHHVPVVGREAGALEDAALVDQAPAESTLLSSLSCNPPYSPPHKKWRYDRQAEEGASLGVMAPAQPEAEEGGLHL